MKPLLPVSIEALLLLFVGIQLIVEMAAYKFVATNCRRIIELFAIWKTVTVVNLEAMECISCVGVTRSSPGFFRVKACVNRYSQARFAFSRLWHEMRSQLDRQQHL